MSQYGHLCFLCDGDRGARLCWCRPDIGRLRPRMGERKPPSGRARALPGKVKARAEGLSDSGSPFAGSPSVGFSIFDGLVMPVVLAVAVCAVLAMLPRLVTLAGLFCDLSSKCIGLGIEIAFAATSIPSLIVVVAAGASGGLLAPEPEISADITLWPGFSGAGFPGAFVSCCCCCCRLRSSSAAVAVAPGEARGDTLVPKRGDLASGEAVRPASAMAATVAELGDESIRLRFNGRAVDWSVAASSGAESGRFRISAVGAVVGAEAWSESMRANAEGCGLGVVVVAIEGHPNWADGLNASLSGSPVESSRCQLPDTGCAAVGGGTGGSAQGCGRVVCGAAGGMASEDLFWTRLVIVALFRRVMMGKRECLREPGEEWGQLRPSLIVPV